MTIGTNDTINKFGTTKTLQTSGSAISTLQLSAAAATTYSASDTQDANDALFTLDVGTMGGTPVAGATIDVHIRPLDIDGTTDAPAPATGASTDAYRAIYVGSFVLKAATTGVYQCIGRDVPRAGEAYLYNGTAQSTGSWTLKMTPMTQGPSA